jgi:hypothetical protein
MVARAFFLTVSLYLAWVSGSAHTNKESIMKTLDTTKILARGLLVLSLALFGGCLTDDKGDEDSGPTISVSPADEVVQAGDNATFSVTATGSGSLTYQWTRNGNDIAGATSASYTFAAGNTDDGVEYKCVVTDANGSTTSSGAFLRIMVKSEDIVLGAQNSATASSLDLDAWEDYTSAQGATAYNLIDLVFAFSTSGTNDSAALYSPIVAKNGVGGSGGFTFMSSWPSANSTEMRIVTVSNWNNVITAADIKALYDAGSSPSPAGRVFVKPGTTIVALSNGGLYVLIRVTSVTQSASGTAMLDGKAKW